MVDYSPKKRFLATLEGKNNEGLVSGFEAFAFVRDPATILDRGDRGPGKEVKDIFGTTLIWPEGSPGAMAHVTEENKVLRDVTNWRNELKLPDFASMEFDWAPVQEATSQIDREKKLVAVVMPGGLFERLHFLMGFQETLINLMIEQESVDSLLEALLEVRLAYVKQVVENVRPDVIIHHDDWGSKQSLLMQAGMWRSLLKERYRRLYGYMRENGIIVIHHGDCHCAEIAEDMAEIGINVWQGVIPDNDITALQRKLGGKMALMGGIDSVIDRPDATEAEIRKEVRHVCETYGPTGRFIPSQTYGAPGAIYPHVQKFIDDEIQRYNNETYGACSNLPANY